MSEIVPRPAPRFELESAPAPRLEPVPVIVVTDPSPPAGSARMALVGLGVLAVGFMGLSGVNFVVDQFARGPVLGWASVGVGVTGLVIAGAGIWRELRALGTLGRIDTIRQDLASTKPDRIARGALAWAAIAPGGPALVPALRAMNDPDAMLALLRAGPGATLRAQAEAQGRAAALQVVAGIAAMPSPAFDVALIGWRGLRLVRQVAALYGVRPGALGALSLLRRTVSSATLVGATELAANAAAQAVLSHPLLSHVVGEMAGAGVAARRMVVLARAAAVACDPVPPPP